MDKLRMESPDLTAQNIDRIAALFPNCITEMLDEEHSTPEKKVYKRAVNFELLKQMLSPDMVNGDEAYEVYMGRQEGGNRGSQQADPQDAAPLRGREQGLGHH